MTNITYCCSFIETISARMRPLQKLLTATKLGALEAMSLLTEMRVPAISSTLASLSDLGGQKRGYSQPHGPNCRFGPFLPETDSQTLFCPSDLETLGHVVPARELTRTTDFVDQVAAEPPLGPFYARIFCLIVLAGFRILPSSLILPPPIHDLPGLQMLVRQQAVLRDCNPFDHLTRRG